MLINTLNDNDKFKYILALYFQANYKIYLFNISVFVPLIFLRI